MSATRPESQSNRSPPVSVNVCSVGSTLIAAGSSSASAKVVSSQLPEQSDLCQSTSQSRPVTVRMLGRPAVTVTGSKTGASTVNFNI